MKQCCGRCLLRWVRSISWTARKLGVDDGVIVYGHMPYNFVMTTKASRAEFRADEELMAQLRRAAELVHEQTSEFIRRAVFERAQRVLAQELTTAMAREQFDELLESLENADDAPELAKLARAPRAFTRR